MSTIPPDGVPNATEDTEPTHAELAEIEREWPAIEAELALLDAEIRMLSAEGGSSSLDWRRLRRAQRRVLALRTRPVAVRRPAAGTEVA